MSRASMPDAADRQPWQSFVETVRADLSASLDEHRVRPFPSEVEKGAAYGDIEPVMTDADLFGWALAVAHDDPLTDQELSRLRERRDELLRSLDAVPAEARGYFASVADLATRAHVIQWLTNTAMRFVELEGRVIVGWSGVEMALREHGSDGAPQFNDAAVPFLQFCRLDVDLDAERRRVTCYQDDDAFGLRIEVTSDPLPEVDGIYRVSEGVNAPSGTVERVEVTMEDGVIAEVLLTVSGQRALLVAGEVEESLRDGLRSDALTSRCSCLRTPLQPTT